MATQEIDVANTRLAELVVDAAENGDEVMLMKEGRLLAKLVPALPDRVPGTARGLVAIRADFDDPLEDFRDYM